MDKEKKTAELNIFLQGLISNDLVTRLQELDKRGVTIKCSLIKRVQANIGGIKTPESV